jgi:hypothetical protein
MQTTNLHLDAGSYDARSPFLTIPKYGVILADSRFYTISSTLFPYVQETHIYMEERTSFVRSKK